MNIGKFAIIQILDKIINTCHVYRPGGIQNFRYIVLKTKSNDNDNSGNGFLSILFRICIATLTLFSIMMLIKRIRLYWTGRHKKYDARYYG